MRPITFVFALTFAIAVLGPARPAHAVLTTGDQLCVGAVTLAACTFGPGADSAGDLETILETLNPGEDFAVHFIAKWEDGGMTPESAGTISFSDTILNGDDEILAGDWLYTPPAGSSLTVAYLALKAGARYAYFDYTTSDMPNQGYFDVLCLFSQVCRSESRASLAFLDDGRQRLNAMSHITAYTPLPGAVWLFLSALAGLFGAGYTRRSRDA